MTTGTTTLIEIEYFERDGWHVFSSHHIPGLYVAHTNLQTAYDDVATSIEMCIKLNLDIDVEVEPLVAFEDFMAQPDAVIGPPIPAHVAAEALQRKFVLRAR